MYFGAHVPHSFEGLVTWTLPYFEDDTKLLSDGAWHSPAIFEFDDPDLAWTKDLIAPLTRLYQQPPSESAAIKSFTMMFLAGTKVAEETIWQNA